jgi:hypothetical protein
MSNNPVDRGLNYQNEKVKGAEEKEKKALRAATLVAFRIRSDSQLFYKRMVGYFFENEVIAKPKLSLLGKACLNIIARRYAAYEEVNLANYVQKQLAAVRGPNAVRDQQLHRETTQSGGLGSPTTRKQTPADLIPPSLRRPPPIDKVKEPEWLEGWLLP